jgi:hypothetical protein
MDRKDVMLVKILQPKCSDGTPITKTIFQTLVGKVVGVSFSECQYQRGDGATCNSCPGLVNIDKYKIQTCAGWGGKLCYERVLEEERGNVLVVPTNIYKLAQYIHGKICADWYPEDDWVWLSDEYELNLWLEESLNGYKKYLASIYKKRSGTVDTLIWKRVESPSENYS